LFPKVPRAAPTDVVAIRDRAAEQAELARAHIGEALARSRH
jgi:hypothetical protein